METNLPTIVMKINNFLLRNCILFYLCYEKLGAQT